MTKLFSRDGGPQGKFARRGRCFDIGTWGGCGVFCPAFIDGECGEPQEIPAQEIVDAHGQGDAEEIMAQYPCFANGAIKNRWSQLDAGFTKARAAVAKAHKRVAQENQPTGDEEKMTDLAQYPIGTIFLSRNNNRFKLIAVDDDRNYPIHCRHSHPGMVEEFTFTEFTFAKTGRFRIDGFPSDLDLVSVEKPLDLSNLRFGDLVERTDGVTGCVTRTAHDSLIIEWQDDKPPSIVTPRGFKGANRIVKTIKFHHPRPVYTCTATVDVEADSEAQARAIMGERVNCAPDNVTAKKRIKSKMDTNAVSVESTALLGLVADIRAAVGDPKGKLMQDELVEHCRKLAHSADWNRRRVEMLSRLQKHMRDPERTLVCDILANGQLLPDPHGKRYGFEATGNEHHYRANAGLHRTSEAQHNQK